MSVQRKATLIQSGGTMQIIDSFKAILQPGKTTARNEAAYYLIKEAEKNIDASKLQSNQDLFTSAIGQKAFFNRKGPINKSISDMVKLYRDVLKKMDSEALSASLQGHLAKSKTILEGAKLTTPEALTKFCSDFVKNHVNKQNIIERVLGLVKRAILRRG